MSASAKRVAARALAAYSKQPQDQAAVKTLVTPPSQKNLPTRDKDKEVPDNDSNENQDTDAARWPVDKPDHEEKQRALPLPSSHPKNRDVTIPRPVFNVPDAPPNSRQRKKTITPVRTPSTPGKDYGHPTKFDYGMPTRRHDAGLNSIFPEKRQKNQGGSAKQYYKRRYQRNKNRKKRLMKRRYRVMKRRPAYKRDQKYREKYPKRYERRSIGVRTPAERAKKWRKDKKVEKRNNPSKRASLPLKALYGPNLVPIEITGFEDSNTAVFVNEYTGDMKFMPVLDFLDQITPYSEEDMDRIFDAVDDAFGLEVWTDEEYDDYEESDWGEPTASNFEILRREQKSPGKLDQNVNQDTSKGTPKKDQTKNDHSWGPPAPGNSKGREAPTSWVGPMTGQPGISTPSKDHKHPAHPHGNPDIDSGFKQPAVEQQSGSSKVIPDVNRSTGDLSWRNKNKPGDDRGYKVAHDKTADTMRKILRNVKRPVVERSKDYSPNLLGFQPRNQVFRFKTGDWKQWVKVLPRPGSKQRMVNGMVIRVKCSCPFHRWQGPEHWATKSDYQYGALKGTATFPGVRDPKHRHAVCKHLVAVFRYIRDNRLKVPETAPRTKLGRYSADNSGNCKTPAPSSVVQRYLRKK